MIYADTRKLYWVLSLIFNNYRFLIEPQSPHQETLQKQAGQKRKEGVPYLQNSFLSIVSSLPDS